MGGPTEPCKMDMDMDAMHYPSLYIDSDKELSLPDEGTMTIKFKKVGSSTNKPRDGKESHSCTVDVLEISNVKGGASKSKSKDEESSSDALDRTRKEVEAEKDEDNGDEEKY